MDGVPLKQAILPTTIPGLSIVPASVHLAGAELELVEESQREFRLKNAIQGGWRRGPTATGGTYTDGSHGSRKTAEFNPEHLAQSCRSGRTHRQEMYMNIIRRQTGAQTIVALATAPGTALARNQNS